MDKKEQYFPADIDHITSDLIVSKKKTLKESYLEQNNALRKIIIAIDVVQPMIDIKPGASILELATKLPGLIKKFEKEPMLKEVFNPEFIDHLKKLVNENPLE